MMQTADMLAVFQQYRGNAVVVPGRGGRHWNRISTRPSRDMTVRNPAMGGHAAFAMGLALALPDERVVLFDSEGDLIMSMGVMSSIVEQGLTNLHHFLLDNECYATTGGQPVPNASRNSYDVIARGCGYAHAYAFEELDEFAKHIADIMKLSGPVFIALKVVPEIKNEAASQRKKAPVRSRPQVIADFKKEFGIA